MTCVLGIDLGTQSVKAVVYDFQQKQVLAVASSELSVDRDNAGKAEQNAADWLLALERALAQLDPSVRAKVKAIGVSGQQHGFVPVGDKGQVLSSVKLWCDTSTTEQVEQIAAAVGGQARAIEQTGNAVVTGFTAPKILWLKQQHPEAYQAMRWVMLPHDYLNYVFTGNACMEFGDASGTGLLDVRERRWSKTLIDAIDNTGFLENCLPPLIAADEIAGTLTAEAAQRFGLPEGAVVSAGGGDNMMGAIGTGNVVEGNVTMSLGTSGTVYAYSDKPVVDHNGAVAAFCSSTGGWLPLLCTMNCTVSTELVRSLFGVDVTAFDTTIATIFPGSDGVLTLPFFNGERTPNLPHGRGCIVGLNESNMTPAHLLRSAAEGATFSLKYGIDVLASLGIVSKQIVLTGGGANSAQWRQMVADVCDLPVVIYQQDEGAAFGAALQALAALPDMNATPLATLVKQHLSVDERRSTHPVAANVQHYRNSYAAYQKAVSHIAPYYQND